MRGSMSNLSSEFSMRRYQEKSLDIFVDAFETAVIAVRSSRMKESTKKMNIFKVILSAILELQDPKEENYPDLEALHGFIWNSLPGKKDFHKQRVVLSSFLSRLKKDGFVDCIGKRTEYRWGVTHENLKRFLYNHRKESPNIMESWDPVKKELLLLTKNFLTRTDRSPSPR